MTKVEVEGQGHLPLQVHLRSETKPYRSKEQLLFMMMERQEPSDEALSEMASGRDGFGMGVLSLTAIMKGKVRRAPIKSLDLSGCSISAKKIFFLLDNRLPVSIEELKLGPSVVKGPALPLLRRFLDRVGRGGEGGDVARVKHLTFADNAIGSVEAPLIFQGLPPFLETLNLEDCSLGTQEAVGAFAAAVREGKLASVRTLKLSEASEGSESVQTLASAFEAAKPLKVENLTLKVNTRCLLCSLLKKEVFPFLRNLVVFGCGQYFVAGVTTVLAAWGLHSLERLHLIGHFGCFEWESGGASESNGRIAKVLHGSLAPRLRVLKMDRLAVVGGDIEKFLDALRSKEASPLESVHLCVSPTVDSARILGRGELKFVRSLELALASRSGVAFLNALIYADAQPFESLSLSVFPVNDASDKELLSTLSAAFRVGRLECLSKINFNTDFEALDERQEKEGRSTFFEVFHSVRLPSLSELDLNNMSIQKQDVLWVCEGVAAGNFPSLRSVDFSGTGLDLECMNIMFGGGGFVCQTGLPALETLQLSYTLSGWGLSALRDCLSSGRTRNIRVLGVECCELNDESMGVLAEIIRGGYLSRLEDLDLENNRFGREGMYAFFGSVSERVVPALKTLRLGTNRLEGGIRALAAALEEGRLRSLGKVAISYCDLTNESMRVVGEALGRRESPAFSVLDFSNNHSVTGEGFRDFLEALRPQSLPNLMKIVFRSRGLDVQTGRGLIQEAQGAGKLRSLVSLRGYFAPDALRDF
uniref:Uncharacterized protein n=1 Tax=Chromera velia CCMP2878 TaxID=1169474 RepID=A0A0G4HG66_9ALVE|eukprot:Cvel_27285.t1-p1 / transcript=Cvel_27285.t1 / gene=Cvel_27285 / organism=Chromera_velia_CCMP2878 / gene_product=hypothetical protein / transcript_product=hypothetical protein / location=Cvel_scaffold3381:1263-5513(-) / protein_length=758 / sequence_SO=supercontig / SO=protein_coding / is_pseudo=false